MAKHTLKILRCLYFSTLGLKELNYKQYSSINSSRPVHLLKITEIFISALPCVALKTFFIKPFEATAKKCENKNLA